LGQIEVITVSSSNCKTPGERVIAMRCITQFVVGASFFYGFVLPLRSQDLGMQLPQMRSSIVTDKWIARGYIKLYLPELGETESLLNELNNRFSIIPGVSFLQPNVPSNYLPGSTLETNRLTTTKSIGESGVFASLTWAMTQYKGKWDYKYLAIGG
jgi:hypothetical protein